MAAENRHKNFVNSMIQYLDRTNLAVVARSLERHSALFFNLKYFEDCFIGGNLDEADDYLSGFTSVDDNSFSTLLFFEIRWHKFILALDLKKRQRARRILREELQTFQRFDSSLKANMSELLRLDDFRDGLGEEYEDLGVARLNAMEEVRNNLEANPLLKNKIVYLPAGNFEVSYPVHPASPFPGLALIPSTPTAGPIEANDQTPAPLPVSIQPLPTPPAASLQPSGTRRERQEKEEEERRKRSRHCLDLVPVNLHPGLEANAEGLEAPKQNKPKMDSRTAPSATQTPH